MALEQIVTMGPWSLFMDDATGAVIITAASMQITIPREDAINLAVTILGWESLEDSQKAFDREAFDKKPLKLA